MPFFPDDQALDVLWTAKIVDLAWSRHLQRGERSLGRIGRAAGIERGESES